MTEPLRAERAWGAHAAVPAHAPMRPHAAMPTEIILEPLRGEREVVTDLCEATEPLRGDRAASSRLPEPLLRTLLALLAGLVQELGFWWREGSVASGLTRLVPTLLALPRNLLALLVHKLVENVTWVGRGGKSVGGEWSCSYAGDDCYRHASAAQRSPHQALALLVQCPTPGLYFITTKVLAY